ncbi:alpha/beta-hydrolase [Hymenopellis radicata]|nr:alpha/beta-hydrolase [Hymenopellis radicata]
MLRPTMSKVALKSSKTVSEPSRTLSHQPVLRWLGNWSPYHTASPAQSPLSSSPSTPPSTRASTPPSPGLASLNEALNEPLLLPTLPPIARLPKSFHHNHGTPHSPPFLDSLARSTMPTATVSTSSRFESYSISTAAESPTSTRPIILSESPTQRTSLDALRSVSQRDIRRLSHTRSISTSTASLDSSNSWNKNWFWFSNNKEQVDELLGEEDRRETVEEETDNFRNKYRAPKNPIVFCHGLLGFDSVTIGPAIAPMEVSHWRGIKEVLEANGAEVLITRVPATSSPIDRAKVLEQKISEVYPGRSVHLIGHSMGGLDCRYLTSMLPQRKFTVLSITTIATPHRGSAFADYFLATLGANRMPSFLNILDMLPNGGGDGKAFEFLTLENMRVFNEHVKDVEGVKYFSWGASYDPGFVDTWKWSHSVMMDKEGPNDGLVSVESAKWGTYLGTLEHVNHLDLVGWINTARYKWASMTGREIKFRPATFYLGIADMLAERVENQPSLTPQRKGGPPSSGGSTNKAGEGVQVAEEEPRRQSSPTLLENGVTMTTGEDIANATGEEPSDSSRPRS